MSLIQMTIIYTAVGKNPLEDWTSPHSPQKSIKCSTSMQSQEWQKDLGCFQGKTNMTVSQVYVPTTNAEKVEIEQFCEDWQDHLELTQQKISFLS